MRKTIILASLKGGTGKSTVTVNLGRALYRKGYRVGLLDVDIVAPTLHKALGFAESPPWQLDSIDEEIVPFELDGLYVLSIASQYGETPAVLWDEPTLIRAMKDLNTLVQWPELDYLLLDSPPSSSGFMQALYNHLAGNLYGVILVFQPTDIAGADLLRTLDFVNKKKVPLIGLIANMAYCLSPSGEVFWPFLSPKLELAPICKEHHIAVLGEVPLTSSIDEINAIFDLIAESIEGTKPLIMSDDLFLKLYKALKRSALKAVVRRL